MPSHPTGEPLPLRRALHAVQLVEDACELPELLRLLVADAVSITGARYGALGVLSEDETSLAEFVTVGLHPDEAARIGAWPTGHGILGQLVSDPRPLRVADVRAYPGAAGFPPHHPHMTSFLGVPVRVSGAVYGTLFVTDKKGAPEFTEADVAPMRTVALAAGAAIVAGRLRQKAEVEAGRLDDERSARDLHDAVIQQLFGVSLTLRSVAGRTPGAASENLESAVSDIDGVIQRLRATIV